MGLYFVMSILVGTDAKYCSILIPAIGTSKLVNIFSKLLSSCVDERSSNMGGD